MARKIPARDIVIDLVGGMSKTELMDKYGLSPGQVRRILQQVARERTARAAAIATDLKAGLSDSELRDKHQLSARGLARVLKALIEGKLVTAADLDRRHAGASDSVIVNIRRDTRHAPTVTITVFDHHNPGRRCLLRDISEHGLAVVGTDVCVNQRKTFAVLGDDFGEVAPFELEAQCRWVRQPGPEDLPIAGFEITKISQEDLIKLRLFVERFSHLPSDG
ncbi:MAG: PilZ domain-containing protein [Desulfomonile tiedjei]|nr:PilZ domain-containing protein [Desulfomonile tiedjei]